MSKISVFIIKRKLVFTGLEGQSATRLIRQLLVDDPRHSVRVAEIDGQSSAKIQDLRKTADCDLLLFLYDDVFITAEGLNVLTRIASERRDLMAVAPVCNISRIEQQKQIPPFFYQTPMVFKWAAEEIYGQNGDATTEVQEIDDICMVFRREILDTLPEEELLVNVPHLIGKSDGRCAIATGVYVHRYGNCYEGAREDLLQYVPLQAGEILDIGCAKGYLGKKLKHRQDCTVSGVELDGEFARIASDNIDHVIQGDIEDILQRQLLRAYDCIICGDVIEHLKNPWHVVEKLRNHLRKDGLFITSIPNIANWSIIYEMLHGRWDYVPLGILSGTHLRFFTKETFRELIENAGYRIEKAIFQDFDLPPRGAEFIKTLMQIMPEANEGELKASEIVFVASNEMSSLS
jgi:2-polyprenyl-3-methyl-5-hydroxy-6-metoxy-1,4-benzoquinol methylase